MARYSAMGQRRKHLPFHRSADLRDQRHINRCDHKHPWLSLQNLSACLPERQAL